MSNQVAPEKIVELMNELKDSVTTLSSLYRQLNECLEEEHEIARLSDLGKFEKVVARKTLLTDEISRVVAELKSLSMSMQKLKVGSTSPRIQAVSLTETVQIARQIIEDLKASSPGGLAVGVMEHLEQRLSEAVGDLIEIRALNQPRVEMNKLLMETLLQHRRENVRFWQEVALESEATYNQDGKSRSEGANSTIVVRT